MDPQSITKEMIPQPELWRCAMEINASSIEVVLLPPVDSERALYTSIILNPEAPSHEKAVQEAIYANPVLLSDFKRVDALFDCEDITFVPSQLLQRVEAESVCSASGINTDGKRIECDELPGGVTSIYAVDAALIGFIRRTFFNVRTAHRLSPIVSNAMNSDGLLAVIERSRLDIIGTADGKLQMARTIRCKTPQDATYFIIATRKSLELHGAPLLFAGSGEDADTVRGYVERYCEKPLTAEAPALPAVPDRDTLNIPRSLSALLS
ncbi:MAG: DUF3822 family protein [Muribaculaceae bacterium]|nr:DUF3822 family protein [Muribaculaceae bacterium]